MKTITVAITGASGSIYAIRLLSELLKHPCKIYVLISDAAREVFRLECNIDLPKDIKQLQQYFLSLQDNPVANLMVYSTMDWSAPVASGSNCAENIVICPCSMGTLSAAASGASNNLIERAIDVSLKEKKSIILLPREMPLSSIHLENMLKLSKMGVTIMPASPGFYHQAQSIDDIVNFVVARILDHLKISHQLITPWGSES